MVYFNLAMMALNKAPPSGGGTPVLLTGNDPQFAVGYSGAKANTTHSGTLATVDMVEKSDVSHRPNTNGLIMYAKTAYPTSWGYLTNLLDTRITADYTGKWFYQTASSQDIVFEFGSSFTFTKVVWKERSYGPSYPDPTLARIKYWDGSAYQEVPTTQTTSPSTGSNRVHTYTITTTPPSSQYIRMEFEPAGAGQFVIGEIEVYGY